MQEQSGGVDAAERPPSAWRNRDFRLLWMGQTVSIFGDRISGLALPWLVLLSTGSPPATGITFAAGQLPALLLSPFAGMAADRWERRRLMLICNLISALALFTLASVALLGYLTYPHILIVMFVLGSASIGFLVAYGALLPELVGRRSLASANAALEASDALGTVAGPALGGALLQLLGPALALAIDALSFICSALTLASLHYCSNPAPIMEEPPPFWHEASAGLRTLLKLPSLRLASICSVGLNLFSASITLLLIQLTQQRLGLSAGQAGFILAAAGIGGLCTSLLANRLTHFPWGRLAAVTLLVAAGACIWLSYSTHFWEAFVGNGILDGCIALSFIIVGSASSAVTPDRLLGRVNAACQALYAIVRSAGPLVLGVVLTKWGTLPAFICCAALLAGLALLAA